MFFDSMEDMGVRHSMMAYVGDYGKEKEKKRGRVSYYIHTISRKQVICSRLHTSNKPADYQDDSERGHVGYEKLFIHHSFSISN